MHTQLFYIIPCFIRYVDELNLYVNYISLIFYDQLSYMIEDIRRMRGDIIDFIFEWQKQYLTSERNRLMFCLLYART